MENVEFSHTIFLSLKHCSKPILLNGPNQTACMGLGVHGPKSIGSRLTSGLTHFPFSRARVLSESPAAAAAAAMLRSALRRGGAAVRHAASSSSAAEAAADGSPGALLRRKVAERERARRRPRDPSRDEFFVATPESLAWLDSASLPMVLTAAAIALFTKLLMMVSLLPPR